MTELKDMTIEEKLETINNRLIKLGLDDAYSKAMKGDSYAIGALIELTNLLGSFEKMSEFMHTLILLDTDLAKTNLQDIKLFKTKNIREEYHPEVFHALTNSPKPAYEGGLQPIRYLPLLTSEFRGEFGDYQTAYATSNAKTRIDSLYIMLEEIQDTFEYYPPTPNSLDEMKEYLFCDFYIFTHLLGREISSTLRNLGSNGMDNGVPKEVTIKLNFRDKNRLFRVLDEYRSQKKILELMGHTVKTERPNEETVSMLQELARATYLPYDSEVNDLRVDRINTYLRILTEDELKEQVTLYKLFEFEQNLRLPKDYTGDIKQIRWLNTAMTVSELRDEIHSILSRDNQKWELEY